MERFRDMALGLLQSYGIELLSMKKGDSQDLGRILEILEQYKDRALIAVVVYDSKEKRDQMYEQYKVILGGVK